MDLKTGLQSEMLLQSKIDYLAALYRLEDLVVQLHQLAGRMNSCGFINEKDHLKLRLCADAVSTLKKQLSLSEMAK